MLYVLESAAQFKAWIGRIVALKNHTQKSVVNFFCCLTLLHFNVEVSICNKTVKDELENDPVSGRLIIYHNALNMKIEISYKNYIIKCRMFPTVVNLTDRNPLTFCNYEVINGNWFSMKKSCSVSHVNIITFGFNAE